MNNLKLLNSIRRHRTWVLFACLVKIICDFARKRLEWRQAAKLNGKYIDHPEKTGVYHFNRPENRTQDPEKMGATLDSFLRTLTEQDQMVFLQRYLCVDTIVEIASRSGICERTVEMQLKQIRVKLRSYLEELEYSGASVKDILVGLKYIGNDLIENAEKLQFTDNQITSADLEKM